MNNGDGDWISFNGILPPPVGNEEVLWRDIYTRLQKGDDWIWVYATARMMIRHNESGIIKHAKFVSMGCESPMGSIDGQNFGGKCKLRGKMMDPEDLPPDFPLTPGKADENSEQKTQVTHDSFWDPDFQEGQGSGLVFIHLPHSSSSRSCSPSHNGCLTGLQSPSRYTRNVHGLHV